MSCPQHFRNASFLCVAVIIIANLGCESVSKKSYRDYSTKNTRESKQLVFSENRKDPVILNESEYNIELKKNSVELGRITTLYFHINPSKPMRISLSLFTFQCSNTSVVDSINIIHKTTLSTYQSNMDAILEYYQPINSCVKVFYQNQLLCSIEAGESWIFGINSVNEVISYLNSSLECIEYRNS